MYNVYIYICIYIYSGFERSNSVFQMFWLRVLCFCRIYLNILLWIVPSTRIKSTARGWVLLSIDPQYVLNFFTGWWFGTFFIFPNSWDDDPIWRTPFFRGVGIPTTNQVISPGMVYSSVFSPWNFHQIRVGFSPIPVENFPPFFPWLPQSLGEFPTVHGGMTMIFMVILMVLMGGSTTNQ